MNMNVYFVMMFGLAIFAVEKISSIEEQAGAYMAILWWLFLFGIGKVIQEKREKGKLIKEEIGEE